MLDKGWNPRIPLETLSKSLIEINPKDSSFRLILDKVKHNARESGNDTFNYAKKRWDKSHKVPDLQVGDLVVVSTLNFNNIKTQKKLLDSCVGAFLTFS
ncbi:hypothetical protein O181_001258 [Austropuccinia psidii MF-1]|uniref:Uncharacterized protein n=1 Tax=Austropuccinia psidii MF-1 TaxID=1389203 RepID=A0A9Q3GBJ7_9BASI|nr:hypothetical protein [Austropuccinia psidii MF-1]